MTEEQKDAIVRAAKEMVDFWTGNDIMYMKCPQNLIDAVRATERRWTVTDERHGSPFGDSCILSDGQDCGYTLMVGHKLAHRIARLLNEDDAKA